MKNLIESLARRYVVADTAFDDANANWLRVDGFLASLESGVATIAKSLSEQLPHLPTGYVQLMWSPEYFTNRYRGMAIPIFKLATGALQMFNLTPAERKAANWLAKKVQTRFRYGWVIGRPIPKKEAFEQVKILVEFRDTLRLLKGAYKRYEGKAADPSGPGGEEGNTVKAGSFTLVNAGGFKPEVMDSTRDLMIKAESLLRGSGLGQVCYGRVTLTQSIGYTSNVLAFYEKSSDSLYVRALVKATNKTLLATVLHELGHRYDMQFLKNDSAKRRLYYRLMGKAPKLKPPAIGDTLLLTRGNVATVTAIEGGTTVVFVDSRGRSGRCSFEQWWSNLPEEKLMVHPVLEGFVSTYAGKTPEENFAEMFSYYVMGDLPVNQAVLFENLVFGDASMISVV